MLHTLPSASSAAFSAPSKSPAVRAEEFSRSTPAPSTSRPFRRPNRPLMTAISASTSKASPKGFHKEEETPTLPNWGDFASCVSGEWDGHGVEFTNKGIPIELPENVVPEAFRDWEVQVFDWQTQCPTLAESGPPKLTYKLIKLLPTVGCEADAATRYTIEERIVGGTGNKVSIFAYDQQGNYVAVWNLNDGNGGRTFELEHCLVDQRDRENRLRIIQLLWTDGTTIELQKIKIFSENWYGPFRNGEQLGGCALRQSAFASTDALEASKVLGSWQGTMVAANTQNARNGEICELVDDGPQKVTRDQEGLVTLPKQLWSRLNKREGCETWCEVGWLLDHGRAMTSSCALLKDGTLKKILIGQESKLF